LGIIFGAAIALVALFFWYGLDLMTRQQDAQRSQARDGSEEENMQNQKQEQGTSHKDKIDQVLNEARMVLPGAQALLGFQFVAMLTEAFDKLPETSKFVHLASFILTALSTVLLIAPAAYHRIVERGENTERFERFASRTVLASMVPLALGVSGEFYVVTLKVSQSDTLALATGGVILLVFFGLWFAYTYFLRAQRNPEQGYKPIPAEGTED
jgi:hypothetical protein